jgi:hypothetical protein
MKNRGSSRSVYHKPRCCVNCDLSCL